MSLPNRKSLRLKEYDYNTPGAYFITICTVKRRELLSKISVGTGVLDCPQNTLTTYGEVAEKHILEMDTFYNNITVDKYVIMPNHIHLLLRVEESGRSGTPVPTNANSIIARFVSTLKRFCNKACGENIWQSRYYDHIIRNEQDYDEIWQYIENNPAKWEEDKFYNQL